MMKKSECVHAGVRAFACVSLRMRESECKNARVRKCLAYAA